METQAIVTYDNVYYGHNWSTFHLSIEGRICFGFAWLR